MHKNVVAKGMEYILGRKVAAIWSFFFIFAIKIWRRKNGKMLYGSISAT